MRKLRAIRRRLDKTALMLASPLKEHFDERVDEEADIYEGNELRIAYRSFDGDEVALLQMLEGIAYGSEKRVSGLVYRSRVFGTQPRNPIRIDWCAIATLAYKDPAAYEALLALGASLSGMYAELNPRSYAKQAATMDAKVLPEWRIPNSVYTSGIINQTTALGYHHDAGNFKDAWSAMLVLPNRIQGGELVVPEFRMAFAFDRPALLFFDGQSLLHGVMPIVRARKVGYRYSIVYYSLSRVCDCLPIEQELARAQEMRMVREKRRVIYGTVPGVTPANIHKYEKAKRS